MELDELKQAWGHLELRQRELDAMVRSDLHDRGMEKTRAILRRGLVGQALEILAWTAFVAYVAPFWVEHRHVTHWLVIGLVLHVYGVAAIWSSATRFFLLTRIYLFDAPVLVLQQRVAQLRRFRFYSTLALGLPWWCLWLLVTMVALQQIYGVDLYLQATHWVWANMALGVAGMAFSVWLAHRLAGRSFRSSLLTGLVEDMSGRGLRRAMRQLDEIVRFERE